jgi:hypothetical protein
VNQPLGAAVQAELGCWLRHPGDWSSIRKAIEPARWGQRAPPRNSMDELRGHGLFCSANLSNGPEKIGAVAASGSEWTIPSRLIERRRVGRTVSWKDGRKKLRVGIGRARSSQITRRARRSRRYLSERAGGGAGKASARLMPYGIGGRLRSRWGARTRRGCRRFFPGIRRRWCRLGIRRGVSRWPGRGRGFLRRRWGGAIGGRVRGRVGRVR